MTKEIEHIKFGALQYCPKCKMGNPSGLFLPGACIHCHGTGKVDFGHIELETSGSDKKKNSKRSRR